MRKPKPRVVTLNVKLTRPHKGLPAVLTRLKGVVQATQTFPDEQDAELSTLYILQVETARAKTVLRALKENPAIAFAEASAPRKAFDPSALRS